MFSSIDIDLTTTPPVSQMVGPPPIPVDWLKSSERREFLKTESELPANRFLSAYWNKVHKERSSLFFVLGVGCGLGDCAVPFQGHDHSRFVGLDSDPLCVRSCRDRFKALEKSYTFGGIKYQSMPDSPKNYEFVLINRVLEYTPKYEHVVSAAWRDCLDAMLIITTQTVESLRGFCEALIPQSVVQVFSVRNNANGNEELIYLVKKKPEVTDFTEIHKHYVPQVPLPFSLEIKSNGTT